ncbi:MAG: radical SAM protein [Lentisphaeria bacterium]|nr:radical SAM protein [Lentisphaeria bacterium]
MTGVIFDIHESSLHDGNGLRITVFFKGCPLRCRWCHSPEGQSMKIEKLFLPDGTYRMAGEFYEAKKLGKYLRETAELIDNGGITFSGGEPLMQGEFLLELLNEIPDIHTIVETCGVCDSQLMLKVAEKVSLIHYGLKIIDSRKSEFWTGCDSKTAIDNLIALDKQSQTPYIIRMPLLAKIIDNENNMRDLMNLINSLDRVQKVEFLPSNSMASAKYALLQKEIDPLCQNCPSGKLPDFFKLKVPCEILS